MNRMSWDETWMTVADAIAARSRCDLARVGAVIVTTRQKVNSCSYNGPMAGLSLTGTCCDWCPRFGTDRANSDYSNCLSIHAEANAIARADHSEIEGGTMYVSRSCCINCVRLIGNSGIKRIVHRVTTDDLHRDPERTEKEARAGGLNIVRWSMPSLLVVDSSDET
jgi:dCMP deaminase